MRRITNIIIFVFFLKIIILLIAKGFSIDLFEKYYENNNKL